MSIYKSEIVELVTAATQFTLASAQTFSFPKGEPR